MNAPATTARRSASASAMTLRPDLAIMLEAVSQVRLHAMDQLVDMEVECDVTATDTLASLDQGAADLVDELTGS